MTDKMVEANGVTIRTESFGDKEGVPLILIMGATAPGIYWPERFINKFLDQGRFVIRYDNRDTGKTTCVDFNEHPYNLEDMASDAIAVMDAYGIDKGHVAGASMGGMIVQTLMLQHALRLRTATLIMSTPLSGTTDEGLSAGDLPGPDPAWMEKSISLLSSPPGSREEMIERKIEQFRMLAGTAEEFDSDLQREIATVEVDQAIDLSAAMNHPLAIDNSSPSDRRPLLASTKTPTLVIHGTEDPILPYEHGVSLAETISGCELMTLDKAGHEIPRCYEDEIVRRMIGLQDAND